jgi:spore coat-associated protein N
MAATSVRLLPLPALLLAGLLACGALAAMVGGDSPPAPRGEAAAASASYSEGSLALSNSRDGSAILSASGMAPGSVTSGTVTIANTGTLAGEFALADAGLTETPGSGGGLLSSRLQLLVEDVTAGAGTPVYSGPLADLGSRALGRFESGTSRTYRFTVSFPDGGSPAADNALQNAALNVRYDWSASSNSAPAAGPRLTVRTLSTRRILIRRSVLFGVRCSERCTVSASGRLRAGGVFRLRAPARSVAAGDRSVLSLPLSRASVAAAYRVLRKGGRVPIAVTVRARGASGRSAVSRRKLILVPEAPRRGGRGRAAPSS